MATYTYLFCDLRTGIILEELPLTQCSFSTKLNGVGDLQAQIMLRDRRVVGKDVISATQPGRTSMFVDKDGRLVWGGIIWDRNYHSETGRLMFGGQTFESYLYKRHLEKTVRYITRTDQLQIVKALFENGVRSQGIAWDFEVLPTHPEHATEASTTRRVDYANYMYHNVGQEIESLSQLEDAFDWRTHLYYDERDQPQVVLQVQFPHIGKHSTTTNLYFDFPGNIKSFEWPENASDSATWEAAMGAGQEATRLRVVVQNEELHKKGWPRLDRRDSFQDVTRIATLSSHANATLDAHNPEKAPIPRITVASDRDPVLGTYHVGDYARFSITDGRFAHLEDSTLEDTYRILQMNVTTASSANPESVYFYLTGKHQ